VASPRKNSNTDLLVTQILLRRKQESSNWKILPL